MFILLLIIFHNFCSSVLIFAGTANFFFPMEIWKLVVVTCMLLASIEYTQYWPITHKRRTPGTHRNSSFWGPVEAIINNRYTRGVTAVQERCVVQNPICSDPKYCQVSRFSLIKLH